jgi:hypothetical protein
LLIVEYISNEHKLLFDNYHEVENIVCDVKGRKWL